MYIVVLVSIKCVHVHVLVFCDIQHRKDQMMSLELLDTEDPGDEENQHEMKVWTLHDCPYYTHLTS